VLQILQTASGAFISGENLAAQLGISRVAIWKLISSLESEGYPLERGTKGYRLEPDAPTPQGLPFALTYKASTTSTQDDARVLARAGAAEFNVVLSEIQTAGRGRRAKVWHSPAGAGLYFTVLLRPTRALTELGVLPLLAGVALRRAIVLETGFETLLKWSNDLLCSDGRKLAGVLLEAEIEDGMARFVLLGMGVNLRVQDFPSHIPAAALEEFVPRVDRKKLLLKVILELQKLYGRWSERGSSVVLKAWREENATLGREVTVLEPNGSSFRGVALDLNSDGALIVKTPGGNRTVNAGEVSLQFVSEGQDCLEKKSLRNRKGTS
jgi:BirA family transcriptional regulator, biotin operon repressor / biotin---[acetyl-CoA-carboxylase] ligase